MARYQNFRIPDVGEVWRQYQDDPEERREVIYYICDRDDRLQPIQHYDPKLSGASHETTAIIDALKRLGSLLPGDAFRAKYIADGVNQWEFAYACYEDFVMEQSRRGVAKLEEYVSEGVRSVHHQLATLPPGIPSGTASEAEPEHFGRERSINL